jgi:hypothetical protein
MNLDDFTVFFLKINNHRFTVGYGEAHKLQLKMLVYFRLIIFIVMGTF